MHDNDVLSRLSRLAVRQMEIEREIRELEAKIKVLQAEHTDISQGQIVDLMSEIGMDEFKTKEGFNVSIDKIVKAGLPKKDLVKRAEGISWLKEHGHSGMIKKFLGVALANHEDPEELCTAVEKLGFNYKLNEDVHWATLTSFVKKLIEEGEEFPMEAFGVYITDKAKVKGK